MHTCSSFVQTNPTIFFGFAVQLLITIVFFERGSKCTCFANKIEIHSYIPFQIAMAWSFLFYLDITRL
jgi:hypothetical protein